LRILHIDKFLPPTGGVGSYVRALAALQRGRGDEVVQFGCVGADGPAAMPRWFDFTSARTPGALARMIHNPEAAAKLAALLRARPVDVAHLHNIYHHLTPSILPVLAAANVGVVMTVNDYRLACPTKHFLRPDGVCRRCLPNRYWHAVSPRCAGLGGVGLAIESAVQRLLRRYFAGVSFFLCPTRYMRDVLVQTGAGASKAVVVRNVIGCGAAPDQPPRAQRELLWAGRLSPEKAPERMLSLAEALPKARIVLCGDGPLAGDLQQDVEQRGLTNVTLTGRLAPKALTQRYARATAVVLTSRWLENSPMTMLEAMQAGRCVIVPDHAPLREWVEDGRTGRTYRADDPVDMASVAAEVCADAGARDRMARAGQQLVAERHDPGRLLAQLDRCYEGAIRRCALRW